MSRFLICMRSSPNFPLRPSAPSRRKRAQLWRCQCGTGYAVPVALVRPVSLLCERCGRTVELDPSHAAQVKSLCDAAGLIGARVVQDLSKTDRFVIARQPPR